jgi:hypothetical protein
MLTDQEANEIHAAHEALPGTKPDGFSWTFVSELQGHSGVCDWLREKTTEWRTQGMKHLRATIRDEDGTVWLEAWKEAPEKEAPFDPPYTAART